MSESFVAPTIRVGVFDTPAQVERAMAGLLAAGFRRNEISVICSEDSRARLFAGVKSPPLPSDLVAAGAAAGGTLGAGLAGLAALAGIVTAVGVSIAALGPLAIALGLGAASGGFVGAMMARGLTTEAANYFDQAVSQGKVLVAVEEATSHVPPRLATAERIFKDAGAEPVPL